MMAARLSGGVRAARCRSWLASRGHRLASTRALKSAAQTAILVCPAPEATRVVAAIARRSTDKEVAMKRKMVFSVLFCALAACTGRQEEAAPVATPAPVPEPVVRPPSFKLTGTHPMVPMSSEQEHALSLGGINRELIEAAKSAHETETEQLARPDAGGHPQIYKPVVDLDAVVTDAATLKKIRDDARLIDPAGYPLDQIDFGRQFVLVTSYEDRAYPARLDTLLEGDSDQATRRLELKLTSGPALGDEPVYQRPGWTLQAYVLERGGAHAVELRINGVLERFALDAKP
jgi:hypothetical protein